jgi:hypothetical protein
MQAGKRRHARARAAAHCSAEGGWRRRRRRRPEGACTPAAANLTVYFLPLRLSTTVRVPRPPPGAGRTESSPLVPCSCSCSPSPRADSCLPRTDRRDCALVLAIVDEGGGPCSLCWGLATFSVGVCCLCVGLKGAAAWLIQSRKDLGTYQLFQGIRGAMIEGRATNISATSARRWFLFGEAQRGFSHIQVQHHHSTVVLMLISLIRLMVVVLRGAGAEGGWLVGTSSRQPPAGRGSEGWDSAAGRGRQPEIVWTPVLPTPQHEMRALTQSST